MRLNAYILLLLLPQPMLHAQSVKGKLFTSYSSKQTGIDFSNDIRETGTQNILAFEYMYNGGGVATGDLNNDGLPDVFLVANMKSTKLYLNKGNFQFEDITKHAKVGGRKDWKTGVTMVDINGDGWLDIYLCYSGKGSDKSRRNELFINNKDLTFSERAKEYGLDDAGCSTQAIFFDYDLDGDLDCYVLNHNIKAYKNVELQYLKTEYDTLAADRLYRNDNGRFNDVSTKAGISGNPISFGLGVAVTDFNNDGWPDLYVSNDYTEQDYCYINNKNGTFSSREFYMFSHLSQFSMGSDAADINNDGYVDLITLDMLPEDNRRQKLLQGQDNYELYQEMSANGFHFQFMRNMLQLNNGNGTFSEIGQLAGISNTDWSWSPLFADLDNDGNKDIVISSGYLRDYTNKDFLKFWGDYLVKQVVKRDSIDYMDIIKLMPVTPFNNYAFRNNGNLGFENVGEDWGLNQTGLSNGVSYADLDNDGDLDLVVNKVNEPAGVYRNESAKSEKTHYLDISLKGNGKNSFGLGAKIHCYTGSSMQSIEQMPTRGYQSSVSERLHIGLGTAGKVDSIRITWPGGMTETQYNLPVDRTLLLEQRNATAAYSPINSLKKKLFTLQSPIIPFSHLQLEYNDFKRQPLMPVMLSQCGPRFRVADLDGNGKEDIFIAGSQGQGDELFMQGKEGVFTRRSIDALIADSLATSTDLSIFDANGDGILDIYLTSGGYADYLETDERLQDRLLIGDGAGGFSQALNALPPMMVSKSAVASFDADGDADQDLFIAGRVIPGEYPRLPRSYLLINDGKGKFTDASAAWLGADTLMGMLTTVTKTDIDGDGRTDLLLAGEWMAPVILLNKGNRMQRADMGLDPYAGWWNTIELFDADNDGDLDLIAGNWGLNSQMKASGSEPIEMIWKDFDKNGSIDPFLCTYIKGKSYPFVTRDELLDQIYPMRRKFTDYKSYGNASLTDIFTPEELQGSQRMKATHLATSYFENKNGRFIEKPLPVQAQFSPVYKIIPADYNQDGFNDLLLLGNNEYPRLRMGKMDANLGTVLLNDKKGNFRYCISRDSGLLLAGDVKDAAIINVNGSRYLLVGVNNSDMVTYKISE